MTVVLEGDVYAYRGDKLLGIGAVSQILYIEIIVHVGENRPEVVEVQVYSQIFHTELACDAGTEVIAQFKRF
jgi:hypothetical protein